MADSGFNTPYRGQEKLIVAFDIGSTQSAVSFMHAYNGSIPTVRMVTRWPGQPSGSGDSKIPTIVAYKNGTPVVCGVEAQDYVADDAYEIAKWFKLHLHPDSMKVSDQPPEYGSSETAQIRIPELPSGVTLMQVYVAFMSYIFKATEDFFAGTTPNGVAIWQRLQHDMVIVMAIPNGWDTQQQEFLKRAAIEAGMVSSDKDADLRIEFISEAEASVHYVLQKSNNQTWLRKGVMFAVTDCGGSTIDSTLYECKSAHPRIILEEVVASECVQAGGVFVDAAAYTTLANRLRGSSHEDKDQILEMIDVFEKKTKRLFDGTQNVNTIQFGGRTQTDRPYGILNGRISLSREEMASTFDSAIVRTVNSCLKLLRGHKIQHLILVGGFGESPYLRKRLGDVFGRQGTEIVTVEEPTKKAAAEGAAIWYTKQLVIGRAARVNIGIDVCPMYDQRDKGHIARRGLMYIDADGCQRIPGRFEVWITKDFVMNSDFHKVYECRNHYADRPTTLSQFSLPILAWSGDNPTQWVTDPQGALLPKMKLLCRVEGDLTPLLPSLRQRAGPNGTRYWCLDYKVLISFGGTKLKARFQWMEGRSVREGPLSVVPGSAV
ncbi:SubName: Full=Uncharacterized protein {ECO:0000313/EMBL:CCA74289.1} [Serendipita indica DSM 11827]|nr:SubName: Full=Uncharacterized protein {ECO:0000313/EMBL:CCA74289.1} [Serendipita indica DSM 11827]